MFRPNGTIREEDIIAFERKIDFCLPADYREFLIATNGGILQQAVINPSKPGQLLIDCLFGICEKRESDLRVWFDEFKGELPDNSLIIGSDAGGGFLLLCAGDECDGVYYYDHAYLFSTSVDDENTYRIYSSFSELRFALIK